LLSGLPIRAWKKIQVDRTHSREKDDGKEKWERGWLARFGWRERAAGGKGTGRKRERGKESGMERKGCPQTKRGHRGSPDGFTSGERTRSRTREREKPALERERERQREKERQKERRGEERGKGGGRGGGGAGEEEEEEDRGAAQNFNAQIISTLKP